MTLNFYLKLAGILFQKKYTTIIFAGSNIIPSLKNTRGRTPLLPDSTSDQVLPPLSKNTRGKKRLQISPLPNQIPLPLPIQGGTVPSPKAPDSRIPKKKINKKKVKKLNLPNYYQAIQNLKWKKGNFVPAAHDLEFIDKPLPEEIMNLTEPIDFAKLYLTDEFIHDITFQSNWYALQNGRPNVEIRENEIRSFFGILLFSSIVHFKNMRLYWHNILGIPCVSETLPQRRFECIRANIHFNDNSKMIDDKTSPNFDRLFKVRPIILSISTPFCVVFLMLNTCLLMKIFVRQN